MLPWSVSCGTVSVFLSLRPCQGPIELTPSGRLFAKMRPDFRVTKESTWVPMLPSVSPPFPQSLRPSATGLRPVCTCVCNGQHRKGHASPEERRPTPGLSFNPAHRPDSNSPSATESLSPSCCSGSICTVTMSLHHMLLLLSGSRQIRLHRKQGHHLRTPPAGL